MIRSAWRRQHGRRGTEPLHRWRAWLSSAGLALVLALLFGAALPVLAHRGGESQLVLTVEGPRIQAEWSIDLSDLALASAAQARPAQAPAQTPAPAPDSAPADQAAARVWLDNRPWLPAQALARLTLSADGLACPPGPAQREVVARPQGLVLLLRFSARCAQAPRQLAVGYRLLFDTDPRHQGVLTLRAGNWVRPAVFTAESPDQVFNLQGSSRWEHVADNLRSGIWHIWTGWDHLLFLLCLVLPAVLLPGVASTGASAGANTGASAGAHAAAAADRAAVRLAGRVARATPAAAEVLKVVTAFTVAHSVTLSLAALQWISLPPRLVESVIAASVVLAAMMNLQAVPQLRRWQAAFAFGLVHGFGFASALGDRGISGPGLVPTLIAFNLGVEIGQLVVVLTLLPLAYALRRVSGNGPGLLRTGSAAIALVALLWFIERAFDLRFMPVH